MSAQATRGRSMPPAWSLVGVRSASPGASTRPRSSSRIHDMPPLSNAPIRSSLATLDRARPGCGCAACRHRARRHARGRPRRRRAVRRRVPADLSRAALHHRERARCCSSTRRRSSWCSARAGSCPATASRRCNGSACCWPSPAWWWRSACRRRPSSPHQLLGDLMMVGAALAWAATTLVIKASALRPRAPEKTLLYQLVVSFPMLALGALLFGERIDGHAVGAGARLARLSDLLWSASTFSALVRADRQRYSASRLSAFTFLTPLFGVAAGHLVLGEPFDAGFCAGRGAGGGRAGTGQPAAGKAISCPMAIGSNARSGTTQLAHAGQMTQSAAPLAAPVGPSGRQCDGRRRRADRRAVDDQHRHRRRRRDRPPGGGAGARRLRDRAHHGRPRRGRRRRAAHQGAAAQDRRATCRSSATSTTSATSCSPIIPAAPRRSTSTASIPAMSASRTRRTASSPPSSRWRSSTTSRCASAPTGARSTRSC